MRHRRWVLVLAVLLLAVLPLAFMGLKVASRNPAVKRAVLARVIPGVAGELSVGELDIGLGSLRFGDVSLEIGDGAYIEVPSATVNLDVPRLLVGGTTAERAISSLIISDPVIVITYGGKAGADSARGDRTFDIASIERYLPDYLGVSDATVEFRDLRTGRAVVADSVDLLLERPDEGPTVGEALGNILGGTDNLTSRFTWDEASSTLSVEGELKDTNLGYDLPLPPDFPFEIRSGFASAVFRASVSPDTVRGLDLDFRLSDADATLTSTGERLSSVSAIGRFTDGRLAMNQISGVWRTSRWAASGIVDLRSGEIKRMSLDARDLPLGPSLNLMGIREEDTDGLFDAQATLSGSLASPVVDATLDGRGMRVRGQSVERASASGRLRRGSVTVDRLDASLLGGRLSIAGSAASGPEGTWRVDAAGDLMDVDVAAVLRAAEADTGAGRVSLRDFSVHATPGDLEMESLLSWESLRLGAFDAGDGAGGLLLRDGNLSVSLAGTDRSYDLSARVRDLLEDPYVEATVDLNHARVDSLFPGGVLSAVPLSLGGELEASGPLDSMSVEGSMRFSGDNAAGTVEVSGVVNGAGSERGAELTASVASRDAAVRGVRIPFTAGFWASADSISVSDLVVEGLGRANVGVSLREDRRIAAGIVVSGASLRDVLSLARGAAPSAVSGLVFASVSVRGTLDDPRAVAQVSVGNGSALGVGMLDATADLSLEGRDFTLTDFALRRLRIPVMTARGYGRLGGELALTIDASAIPGPFLGGSEATTFRGSLGIGGTTDSPTLDGRVESAGPGTFAGVPFDSFVARLSGDQGTLNIDSLVLERRGQYTATAQADIPYGAMTGREGEEATLTVDVTGNPIALLGELSGAGRAGEGHGTLRAVVVGNAASMTLAEARLEARARRFWPVSLFPRLDDLELSIDVSDGAVVSGSASALSGGRELRIRSVGNVQADGRDLASVVIGGVDAGILALSTDEKGVTVNVPGLMLPDDVGRIAMRGKDGAPEFLVGGPAGAPRLWGEIEFSDMSLTYPFIEGGGGQIGNLFGDADWSVRMTAGRNLWYWRPDVNVNVERGRSLDFVGVPSEHSLCVSGRMTASKGTVTYLHTEFDVREVSVDFPSFCEKPRFSLAAETRVSDGTVISLSINTTEDVPVLSGTGVTLDESQFVLASDSPDDNTPEKIMAKLQYGVSYDLLEAEEQATLERRRAVELLGTQIGLRVARPLLSPIESRIRRGLNLDLVRIDIDFVEHFLAQLDMWTAQEGNSPYNPFMANTRMTLGKYVSRDWLLSYLGVVEPFEEELGDQRLGLRSELGIEYEVSRNTSLSFRVVYDPTISGWDRRISIENRYDF